MGELDAQFTGENLVMVNGDFIMEISDGFHPNSFAGQITTLRLHYLSKFLEVVLLSFVSQQEQRFENLVNPSTSLNVSLCFRGSYCKKWGPSNWITVFPQKNRG